MNKPEIAPPTLRSIVLEVRDLLREGWWKFFDWLAVISWKYLFFVSFLVLIIGGIMSLGANSLPFHTGFIADGDTPRMATSGTLMMGVNAVPPTDRKSVV